MMDVQQAIYALERVRDRLNAEADSLAKAGDYGCQFPEADAESIRQLLDMLQGTLPSEGIFMAKLVSADFDTGTAAFTLAPDTRLRAGFYRIEPWAPGASPADYPIAAEPKAIRLARALESFKSSGMRFDGEQIHLAVAEEIRRMHSALQQAAAGEHP